MYHMIGDSVHVGYGGHWMVEIVSGRAVTSVAGERGHGRGISREAFRDSVSLLGFAIVGKCRGRRGRPTAAVLATPAEDTAKARKRLQPKIIWSWHQNQLSYTPPEGTAEAAVDEMFPN